MEPQYIITRLTARQRTAWKKILHPSSCQPKRHKEDLRQYRPQFETNPQALVKKMRPLKKCAYFSENDADYDADSEDNIDGFTANKKENSNSSLVAMLASSTLGCLRNWAYSWFTAPFQTQVDRG